MDSYELARKERIEKFAGEMGYVLNRGLVEYMIYGETDPENWEEPLPAWARRLPKGEALLKKPKN